jgi:hypothetical protein
MAKTASQIVDRALTLIDEAVTTFNTAATTETSIRDQALEVLPEVCRDLIKELPWNLKRYLSKTDTLVVDTLSEGEEQSFKKRKVAYVMPVDYWDLVSLRLNVWARPATETIYIGSREYEVQNNPFTRAGKRNPVVAVSSNVTGTEGRIECFSIEEGDAITETNFQYVSFDNVPDDTGTFWPDELFDVTAKALASQLQIIKGIPNDAAISGQEINNTIDNNQ